MNLRRSTTRCISGVAAVALGATGLIAVSAAPALAAPIVEVFTYNSGTPATYTVPMGSPTRVKITTVAGGGGGASATSTGGAGAVTTTVQEVAVGDVFDVSVGGGGGGAARAGGSASAVSINGTVVAVAGGGGGAAGAYGMVGGTGAAGSTAAGGVALMGTCPFTSAEAGQSADGTGTGGAGGEGSGSGGAGGTSGSTAGGSGGSGAGGGGGYGGVGGGGNGGSNGFSDPGGNSANFASVTTAYVGGGGAGYGGGGAGIGASGGGGWGGGGGSGSCPAGGAGGSYLATAAGGTFNSFAPGPYEYAVTSYGGGGNNTNGEDGVVIIESAPDLSASPTTVDFGDQEVATTSLPSTVIVRNNGLMSATISDISVSGSQFAVAGGGTCSTSTPLASLAECTVSITFTPASEGVKSGTLFVSSDDPASPLSVPLAGTGVTYEASASPTTVDFGNQLVSTTSSPTTVTITNAGSGSLIFGTLSSTGNFAIGTDTCSTQTIAPSGTCTAAVTFTPTSAGAKSGNLTATSDAADVVVQLSGVGVIPGFVASPDPVAFGDQVLGVPSDAETVTVTNSGGAALTFGAGAVVSSNSEFAIATDGCSSSTVSAAGTCTVSVVFTGATEGATVGDLTFTNNAAGSPYTVSMWANTVNPPGVPGTPTAAQTGSGEATITITPPSTGGPVTTYKVTASPGGATCEVAADASPLTCTISGLTAGKSYTFTVQAITGADTSEASTPSSALTITDATTPIVTIKGGKVTGKGKKKKTALSGTTRKNSKTVYVYRAAGKKKPATLVAVRKSKSGKWSAKGISLGGKSSAYFCARVGTHFSDTIRVPSVRSASIDRAGRLTPAIVQRGDQFYCQ